MISETTQSWRMCVPGSYPVLVCCDDILPELDINDAMWLIHYSLPPTKTMFGFRFSSLMNNYKNVFLRSSEVSFVESRILLTYFFSAGITVVH